ncbi:hypothetical protein NPS33_17790 [Pseudomonas putida]|nr:hypothetical protein [Pseudomonas putida]MDD2016750.1 hypothetical protein [Pseudomonas putida]MDD2024462.1 hypothetical protein [Pseudomonas putida]
MPVIEPMINIKIDADSAPLAQEVSDIQRKQIPFALLLAQTRLATKRPELLANLPEFFTFMWRTKTSSREAIKRFVATALPGCRVACLRTNRDTDVFLASMGTQPDQVVQGR